MQREAAAQSQQLRSELWAVEARANLASYGTPEGGRVVGSRQAGRRHNAHLLGMLHAWQGLPEGTGVPLSCLSGAWACMLP